MAAPAKRKFDGSNPSTDSNYGGVAQLGEHLFCKQGVAGSSPATFHHHGVVAKTVAPFE